jgi:signal transduction histidine kinase
VVDDGIGGVALAGNGISGMRQRAVALGGTVEAAPCPGGGFRVLAHLPIVTTSPSSVASSSS